MSRLALLDVTYSSFAHSFRSSSMVRMTPPETGWQFIVVVPNNISKSLQEHWQWAADTYTNLRLIDGGVPQMNLSKAKNLLREAERGGLGPWIRRCREVYEQEQPDLVIQSQALFGRYYPRAARVWAVTETSYTLDAVDLIGLPPPWTRSQRLAPVVKLLRFLVKRKLHIPLVKAMRRIYASAGAPEHELPTDTNDYYDSFDRLLVTATESWEPTFRPQRFTYLGPVLPQGRDEQLEARLQEHGAGFPDGLVHFYLGGSVFSDWIDDWINFYAWLRDAVKQQVPGCGFVLSDAHGLELPGLSGADILRLSGTVSLRSVFANVRTVVGTPGQGSVMLSLLYGVPLLPVPINADQQTQALRLLHFGLVQYQASIPFYRLADTREYIKQLRSLRYREAVLKNLVYTLKNPAPTAPIQDELRQSVAQQDQLWHSLLAEIPERP